MEDSQGLRELCWRQREKQCYFSQAGERCRPNNGILTVIFPAVLVVAKTSKSEIITLDAKSDHMMRGH